MAELSVSNVLALRQSILQRNDALRGATGDPAKAADIGGAGGIGGVGPQDRLGGPDFSAALKTAINSVNELQSQAGAASAAFERGETTDIAAVMLAKQKASIGFETTLQVRNKLLSAYKDIMSMSV